jgi:hypothetical protein
VGPKEKEKGGNDIRKEYNQFYRCNDWLCKSSRPTECYVSIATARHLEQEEGEAVRLMTESITSSAGQRTACPHHEAATSNH